MYNQFVMIINLLALEAVTVCGNMLGGRAQVSQSWLSMTESQLSEA